MKWMGVGGSGWEWVGALFSKVHILNLYTAVKMNGLCNDYFVIPNLEDFTVAVSLKEVRQVVF